MNVTASAELFIARPPEIVWDFTQDYSRRSSWDRSILDATVLESSPLPRIRIRGAGGLSGVLQYKLFDRPRRTSVVLVDVKSRWVTGGGGSWSYESASGGTLWTQTNSLELKHAWLGALARWTLRRETQRAMKAAKRMLEGSMSPATARTG